jgi:hypothetical protein
VSDLDDYRRASSGERAPGFPRRSRSIDLLRTTRSLVDIHNELTLHFCETDPDLTNVLLPVLLDLYAELPDLALSSLVIPWARQHASDLERMQRRFETDPEPNPLLRQPELLLLLERLDGDPDGLSKAWPADLPRRWLIGLSEIWGSPL